MNKADKGYCCSCVNAISASTLVFSSPNMFPLRSCVPLFCRYGPSQSRTVGSAFTGSLRSASGAPTDKEPLKKAKTPQGRFDRPDDTSKNILQKFPDNVNPVTKERGGPRGPEPTRYGDWERKGRCVDF